MADLRVEDIHTAYGLSQVLFGVSLDVQAGECIALIGRNGVGKTTTMRSIMGLTPPRQGHVMWKGQDIARLGPHRICRLGIGFVPEDRRIFPELSVWENLDIARRTGAGGRTTWSEEQVFALFPDLAEIRDRRGGVRPMIERMVVVLPTPLRPMSAMHSPACTSSETPNRTWLSP